MSATRMPVAEVHIDVPLVRRLLESQFPDWANLPIEPLPAVGWDNALFRVGPDLLARLPRRHVAAALVANEHRWLPELAPRLPLPVPVPLGRGRPAPGYPWQWSVCRWLSGTTAAHSRLADRTALALDLGAFVAALHRPGPPDGPRNPWRGIPLIERDETTRTQIAALAGLFDRERLTGVWEEALAAPGWVGPDVWLHGDLHPANMLVRAGRLSAVLDFGDLAVGDPATDLAVAWMMLPPGDRAVFRGAARVDDATWARGRGWALTLGAAFVTRSADNPTIAAIGRRAIDAACADRPPRRWPD